MHQLFNRREINIITDDLKAFLSAVKGPIDKLDYFTTQADEIERIGSIQLDYRIEYIDMILEVENAVIKQLETVEEKESSIQLHLSPASLIVATDRLFFQQIFFRLLSTLLEVSKERSVISVYVKDRDGKCIIEAINHIQTVSVQTADDYFKKHRITNVLHSPPAQKHALLAVYKQLMEDMGGEMSYSFEKGKPDYFRLKFDLA
jgi:K+-sensing histidine kinase KdpD